MLKTKLLHPEILRALGSAGHGSQVLVADANYPFATGASPPVPRVYLNFTPGQLSATQVLEVLVTAIPIEAAHVMASATEPEPAIFGDFRALLPGIELGKLQRREFYAQARSPDLALLIATAEQRLYGNVLLTIGVVATQ